MAVDIKVPDLGESVTEATIGEWLKKKGDSVSEDEQIAELETDKVSVEVYAPADGVLSEIVADSGATVEIGDVIGRIEEGDGGDDAESDKPQKKEKQEADSKSDDEEKEAEEEETSGDNGDEDEEDELPKKPAGGGEKEQSRKTNIDKQPPAVRKLLREHDLDPDDIDGTGKDGRLTKGDVEKYIDSRGAGSGEDKEEKSEDVPKKGKKSKAAKRDRAGREERVEMSTLRKRIAEKLTEAQQEAALLTTFNEIDMSALIDMRERFRSDFEDKHGVRLGFMSFFVKACVTALKEIPQVNAEIDGDEIVYKNYYDLGIAVSTPQGLIVPVVRDCDDKSFAEIEAQIGDLGRRARDGKLKLEELQGGTFSITNGGVFGSLLSTPILNPPQSAILGMHKIENRPVAVSDEEIEIRPMMYAALTYDHRIIDGREAVTFLVRVKECLEDPGRMLFDL